MMLTPVMMLMMQIFLLATTFTSIATGAGYHHYGSIDLAICWLRVVSGCCENALVTVGLSGSDRPIALEAMSSGTRE